MKYCSFRESSNFGHSPSICWCSKVMGQTCFFQYLEENNLPSKSGFWILLISAFDWWWRYNTEWDSLIYNPFCSCSGFERRPLKHPSCPDGTERDIGPPHPPRTGTIPALVPKPPSYSLVKVVGKFYTLKCRWVKLVCVSVDLVISQAIMFCALNITNFWVISISGIFRQQCNSPIMLRWQSPAPIH